MQTPLGSSTLIYGSGDLSSELLTLTAYDGVTDYAGTSGRSLSGAEASFSLDYLPTAPGADVLIGTGSVDIVSSAELVNSGTGGNLAIGAWKIGPDTPARGINITADSPDGAIGASGCITYTYVPVVVPPTPSPTPTTAAPTVPTASATGSHGTLASTGLDASVLAIVAGGLVLTGAAVFMARRARVRTTR